ncbi:hypothetical protein MMC09_004295 [Bachmanniomyces sp. S44760]|nr:hypothetical protein [Bachmanniomyces sp. S44760]
MATEQDQVSRSQPPAGHHGDALATKFVDKTGDWQAQAHKKTPGGGGDSEKKKGPAGGYDPTPVPNVPAGYTVKFTFHRADSLPMADINTLSSDPYIKATLKTDLAKRHKQDPELTIRTKTIRRQTSPEWNAEWVVANVPRSGFELKARIYDEDPGDYDDRLGNVHVHAGQISERWGGIYMESFSIKKRMGSKRAYLIRGCAAMFSKGVSMSGSLVISAEILGKTDAKSGGRMYTVGPCNFTQHYSPLIGRLAGTRDPEKGKGDKKTESYDFQANQMQLAGPVPEELYHRYVEFKPFVAGMFTSHSLRGRILNHALHHQHSRIYNYDRNTLYGSFPAPSKEMTLQFLDLVHFDQGGRIFTYVLTLDGQWRFTETGKEFGIDLLSKHTMHSDVSIYIAYSGEFFIRRLKDPHKDPEDQETHPPADMSGGPPDEEPPRDPAYYQLVIDNDSGTYRPKDTLLPLLKGYLQHNLVGMKISTLDCQKDEEKMGKLKNEQRERKKAEGNHKAFVQGGRGSVSSSDEEDLDAAAGQPKERGTVHKVAHDIAEPKDKVMEWAAGDSKREKLEEKEDIPTSERGQQSTSAQASPDVTSGNDVGVAGSEADGIAKSPQGQPGPESGTTSTAQDLR